MKNAKRILAFALAFCMVLSFAACAKKETPAEEAKPTRDTLIYGLPQEPGKLDPQNDSLLVAKFLNKQIYDTLFHLDGATKEIQANLATEWNWEDDLTLKITIRDDVTFHNGEKLTTEDVLYTIQRCKTGSVSANLFKSFDADNSYIVDSTHLVIKMNAAYAPALNVLANVMSSIVCKKYAESVDATTFARNPIGSGAYKFVEWSDGDSITLVKNDEYWGQKANIQNVVCRIIKDNSSRAMEIETGGIDVTDTLNIADIQNYESNDKINTYLGSSLKVMYMSFNETKPYFQDERVRRAIAYAIDMNAVLKSAYGGGAALGTSILPSTLFGYKNEGIYEYNPEEAKKLLAEAGYADGFTFTIVCPSVATSIKASEAIKGFLAEVNIELKIEEYDAATWMGKKLRDPESDTAPYVFTADTYDPDQSLMNVFAGSGFTTVSKSDEKLNELLQAGRSETDQTKRAAIYAEIQDYIYEHVLALPIAENFINYAYSSEVKGFVPDAGVQLDLKLLYFE